MIASINKTTLGRPALRRNEIVESIHRRIIAGDLKPADRLPTRRSLQQKFNSSMATVQQALSQLASEGFIESRGSLGTFVAALPPHLNHYAVVVPGDSYQDDIPMFWRVLIDGFSALDMNSENTFKTYYCTRESGDSPDFYLLGKNVLRHTVAGIIFLTNPFMFKNSVLLDTPGIPRVAIMDRVEGEKEYNNVAMVSFVADAFVRKALDYFRQHDRKKIAVITNFRKDSWWRDFDQKIAQYGMESRPYWQITNHSIIHSGIRNVSNLLMQLPEDKLPDALLITDDNLTKDAIYGLIDSRSKAVDNLKIISHCNFPDIVPSPLPVKYLGFDSRQMIQACVSSLERQINGGEMTGIDEDVSPLFDDELKIL